MTQRSRFRLVRTVGRPAGATDERGVHRSVDTDGPRLGSPSSRVSRPVRRAPVSPGESPVSRGESCVPIGLPVVVPPAGTQDSPNRTQDSPGETQDSPGETQDSRGCGATGRAVTRPLWRASTSHDHHALAPPRCCGPERSHCHAGRGAGRVHGARPVGAGRSTAAGRRARGRDHPRERQGGGRGARRDRHERDGDDHRARGGGRRRAPGRRGLRQGFRRSRGRQARHRRPGHGVPARVGVEVDQLDRDRGSREAGEARPGAPRSSGSGPASRSPTRGWAATSRSPTCSPTAAACPTTRATCWRTSATRRSQIIERLRYLPLEPFREAYEYTNYGLTAAGEAAAAAAGAAWPDLAQQQLFEPLGMTATSFRFADLQKRTDRAALHARRTARGSPT